jgi:hypothetical protein
MSDSITKRVPNSATLESLRLPNLVRHDLGDVEHRQRCDRRQLVDTQVRRHRGNDAECRTRRLELRQQAGEIDREALPIAGRRVAGRP